LVGDLFASTRRDGGHHLREAFQRIEADGRGVVVYLPPRLPLSKELEAYRNQLTAPPAPPPSEHTLREFGLGAQVLSDLSLKKIRLLTNNPRKIAGIHGYGLEVVDHVPLSSLHGPTSAPTLD
jgi:3,4-dihydroxy 2-butanone 4-phosphate synthase/GTP cyclohydrolase II